MTKKKRFCINCGTKIERKEGERKINPNFCGSSCAHEWFHHMYKTIRNTKNELAHFEKELNDVREGKRV